MVFQSLSAAATIEKQLLRLKLHLAPATNSSNCNSQQISSDFHLKFASQFYSVFFMETPLFVDSGNPRLSNMEQVWRTSRMENMEKNVNINQLTLNTLSAIQNTLCLTQNNVIVNQITQKLYFTVFLATVEKIVA